MAQQHCINTRSTPVTALALVVAAGMCTLLGGCKGKSFLDPSVSGAYNGQPTAVKMPILTRLAIIEDESGDLVEYSDPQPGDLLPQPMQYRLGQGDQLRVTMFDLIAANQSETYEVEVDAAGMIELPQLGRLYVGGKTTEEATDIVKESMKRLVGNPLASVMAVAQRSLTFNLVGGVDRPGPYFVPRANYRLLEAISSGGRFDESAEYVYVIRLVPLSEEVSGESRNPNTVPPTQPAPIEDPMKIIDEIVPPKKEGSQPAVFWPAGSEQPVEVPTQRQAPPPVVNLPDEPEAAKPAAAQQPPPAMGPTRWVFLNGKWTQIATAGRSEAGDSLPEATDELITQRVIRVPIKDLLAGKQSVNVVIRPGDVVRLPSAPVGTIYVSGQIARPGTYGVPSTGGLTLMRLVAAAGGYASLAVPSRIDITRMVGKDTEATIMLDGSAIAARTQPDIYLKANDNIYIGTTFWAYPLAIIRNGFRVSYGWGFIIDRNLSNDLFGPPPVNQFGE